MTVREPRPINLMELRATYTTGGGPDKTILLSAEKHDKEKINTIVVYLRDISDNDFQIGRMAEGRGFKYIEILDRKKLDIKCIIELNGIVRHYKIDIIHGHDYKTDILAYILSILNPKVHLVSTAHGWITNSLKGNLYKWIHMRVLRRFENLITVSKATKSLMVKSGINDNNIKVIYNAIDEKQWCNTKKHMPLRKELNIPEDSFVVGTVGRISDEKDYRTFLDVAAAIVDKIEDVYFVVIGDGKGNEIQNLVDYTEQLGIKKKVFFAGYRSDLLNVYKTLDIFLMTSITEGLPNTMLEAMSMEIPVVSTGVGGIPELVVNGETAFLYEIKDIQGLANKVRELIENEELRENVSKACRRRIEEKFSFERRLRIIEEYYLSIVSPSARAHRK